MLSDCLVTVPIGNSHPNLSGYIRSDRLIHLGLHVGKKECRLPLRICFSDIFSLNSRDFVHELRIRSECVAIERARLTVCRDPTAADAAETDTSSAREGLRTTRFHSAASRPRPSPESSAAAKPPASPPDPPASPPERPPSSPEPKACSAVVRAPSHNSGSSSECENAISYPLFMTGCKEMKTGCKHANDRPFGPLGGPGAVFTCSHPCTSPVWRVSRDRAA